MAVTAVVEYYKEKTNAIGTINPMYLSSWSVSRQAVNGNVSSESKGYPGLFSLVVTLPAQLILHLIKMHRTQLPATICSSLLKLVNERLWMRQPPANWFGAAVWSCSRFQLDNAF